jgi:hypothetical protein
MTCAYLNPLLSHIYHLLNCYHRTEFTYLSFIVIWSYDFFVHVKICNFFRTDCKLYKRLHQETVAAVSINVVNISRIFYSVGVSMATGEHIKKK